MSRSDVLAAQAGDPAAFHRLVEQHSGVICSITAAITADPVESEEVAQEVFVAAWLGLDKLRSPESFGPWLRQMARNRAHDSIRKRVRRREAGQDALARIPASDDPEARLVARERESAVWQALSELEADDREVLILYYREGRSTRQVADLLELSEASVRKRMSRARGRLRADVLARLGESLVRTSPGATFLAAVAAGVAAAAPGTAHAAGGAVLTKGIGAILGGAAVGLSAGLLGVWLGARMTRESVGEAHRGAVTRLAWLQAIAVVWAGLAFVLLPERASLALGMMPLISTLVGCHLALRTRIPGARGRDVALLFLILGSGVGTGAAVWGMSDVVDPAEALGVLALAFGFVGLPLIAVATLPRALHVSSWLPALGALSWLGALPLLLGGPMVAAALGASPVVIGVVLSLCAGFGEELSRAVLYTLVSRRRKVSEADILALGVGHGGIEAVVFGIPILASALLMPAEGPWWFAWSFAIARVLIVGIHMGMSVMVWRGLRRPAWLVGAIALHVALDLAALVLPSAWPGWGLAAGGTVLVGAAVASAALLVPIGVRAARPPASDAPMAVRSAASRQTPPAPARPRRVRRSGEEEA